MTPDTLKQQIGQALGLTPTREQAQAIDTFARFIFSRDAMSAMLLRGSAGTGKTTLLGALVHTMLRLGQKVLLLAPTGRAAKVLSLKADHEAGTIHRRIYRQEKFGGHFSLAPNMLSSTLIIVDEASMIASTGMPDAVFGTGRLLDDLVTFTYSGHNCRLLLTGDMAQLPPVGEEESPALSTPFMQGYGLSIFECSLSQVVRQSQDSGILWNATRIRQMAMSGQADQLPQIRLSGFPDIENVPGSELIEQLASSHWKVGLDDTIVVTRSNKRANIYNQGIRNTVLMREEQLTSGDLLMVVKNNYFWTEREIAQQRAAQQVAGLPPEPIATPPFLANGDRCEVLRVRNMRSLYGFTFADMWLRFPDYDGYELTATVLLDTLTAEAPALTRAQQDQLFSSVMADYAHLHTKPERIKAIKQDPYFNAIQVKFAYAVTCHKAQGGQWAHVYVDQGYMTDDMLGTDYLHWLYTAFTRATEKLYLVNWPKTQTDGPGDDD